MSFLLRDRTIRIGLVDRASTSAQIPNYGIVSRFFGPIPDPKLRIFDTNAINNFVSATDTSKITLSGVNEITFQFTSDIAVEQGISVAFIQPWYIKPAQITIRGTSYMGAYPLVQRRDYDADDIYNQNIQSLNEFGSLTSPGNKNQFQLEIINNPQNADVFLGYIKDFQFSENVDKPFLFNYSIIYVGKPQVGQNTKAAQNAASRESAAAISPSATTPSGPATKIPANISSPNIPEAPVK